MAAGADADGSGADGAGDTDGTGADMSGGGVFAAHPAKNTAAATKHNTVKMDFDFMTSSPSPIFLWRVSYLCSV